MIEVKNLCFSRKDGSQEHVILDQLNLSVATAQHLALLGDSGSGKTTFLHLLAGLLRTKSGTITVNDQILTHLNDHELALYRRRVGLVFQHYELLECLTVKQNILFQHKLNFPHQPADEFNQLVDVLGLSHRLNALPHQLSGGEQQRVSIARALLHQPRLVLADEPTGNLDLKRSYQVVELLTTLCRDRNINLIMVTHSHQLARYFEHVKTLKNGTLDQ
ncbi:ABC transporter ATP-binding protein [Alteromonas ponticola]|uniref:ABC transporter ATP-binding protein n=1 Tax=Alteromonas aquimaris TaxID=2998417 RepID=A0ABT3PAU8_9ALTE|nr:ABC transporter ATP-binding protein [Alteromonas aquimaris]MCW8109892.1 ABC transporter ATP-binding protein [Alteromonas aquimaris]